MTFNSLLRDEAGGTAIEYSLIAALIAVAILTIVMKLGDQVVGLFASAAAGLT